MKSWAMRNFVKSMIKVKIQMYDFFEFHHRIQIKVEVEVVMVMDSLVEAFLLVVVFLVDFNFKVDMDNSFIFSFNLYKYDDSNLLLMFSCVYSKLFEAVVVV